jgi:hypothetical protein
VLHETSVQLLAAPLKHNIPVDRAHPDYGSTATEGLPHAQVFAWCSFSRIPRVGLGHGEWPIADDPGLATEVLGVAAFELEGRVEVARRQNYNLSSAARYVDFVGIRSLQLDVDVTGSCVRRDRPACRTDVDRSASGLRENLSS